MRYLLIVLIVIVCGCMDNGNDVAQCTTSMQALGCDGYAPNPIICNGCNVSEHGCIGDIGVKWSYVYTNVRDVCESTIQCHLCEGDTYEVTYYEQESDDE